MTIINKATNNNGLGAGEEVDNKEHLCTVGGTSNWCSRSGKHYGDTSKKLMDLPFDPAIPPLGIYPKEPKTLIWKNISTPMFIAALFTVAKIWKKPKCPSTDEWIKQLWDIYTYCTPSGPGEHYAKWNKPVRERKYHMISLTGGIYWANWTNKQNGDRLIDGEQITASGGGGKWVEGLSKGKKDSLDAGNSVVTAGGRWV